MSTATTAAVTTPVTRDDRRTATAVDLDAPMPSGTEVVDPRAGAAG